MTIHEEHPAPLMRRTADVEELHALSNYLWAIQLDIKASNSKGRIPDSGVMWRIAHLLNRMQDLEKRMEGQ